MFAAAASLLHPRPLQAATSSADAPGAAFGRSALQRQASLGAGAVATAHQLGPAQLEFDSRVNITAAGRAHSQVDRTVLTWDGARNMSMLQSCGEVPLELWRVGERLLVRYNRGQVRQKSGRDMDADALFDQAVGSFGQALAWLGPLNYLAPAACDHDGRPAWRFRLEAAPQAAPAGAAAGVPNSAPQGGPAGPQATPARPAVWRQQLSARQVDGFVVVDQASGLLLHGELTAQATLVHPAAPAARVAARLSHQLRRRAPEQRLTPPPAVGEFRRQLRAKDPIAFYRASLAPAAPAQPRKSTPPVGDEQADDEAGEDGPAP